MYEYILKGFSIDQNAIVSLLLFFFFIKIVPAVFEIFMKNKGNKTTLFSYSIPILDHTVYGKVKIWNPIRNEFSIKTTYVINLAKYIQYSSLVGDYFLENIYIYLCSICISNEYSFQNIMFTLIYIFFSRRGCHP